MENVKNLVTHDQGRTFAAILGRLQNSGYTVHHRVFNALEWGLPQKRERVFIVGLRGKAGFGWPHYKSYFVRRSLSDIIEPEADLDASLRLSPGAVVRHAAAIAESGLPLPVMTHENFAKRVSVSPHSMALRAQASRSYLSVNGVRKLSAREMLRLQGFPDDYKIVVPYSGVRRLAGNSLPVPIATQIAKHIISALWFQRLEAV
jgi:DNA (cytosine-5)-methyltransferase 1